MKLRRAALVGVSALLTLLLQVAGAAPASAAPPEVIPYDSCEPGPEPGYELCIEGALTVHTTVNKNNITIVTRDDYRVTATFGGCRTVQDGTHRTVRHTPIDANGVPEHEHGLHYLHTSSALVRCSGFPDQRCTLMLIHQIVDDVHKQQRFRDVCRDVI